MPTNPKKMLMRANLASKIYNEVLDQTESFDYTGPLGEEEPIGVTLAYLMGAILCGNFVVMTPHQHKTFVRVLLEGFGSKSPVWDSIRFESIEGMALPDRVKKALIATGGQIGNLDEEDYPEAAQWTEALSA